MHKTVLTCDIGTTSLKTAVISKNGDELAFAQCPFKNPDDRYISLEWIKAFERCICEMGEKINLCEAVSISGNGPTVVTEDGSTVLWNAQFDENCIQNFQMKNQCGSLFLPKIIMLKGLYPNEFKKSKTIFSGPEFLIWQLTESRVTILPEERYINAYWTDELLELNKINKNKLPEYKKIGEVYGFVRNAPPKEMDLSWGALSKIKGLPVYGAGPDFIAAMIGTGCTKIGALCDCAGSSEGFNLCIPLPYKDSRIRLLPSVTPGLWNAAVMIPKSGRYLTDYKSKLEKETGKIWTYSEIIDLCFDDEKSEGHNILKTLLENSENAMTVLKEIADNCNISFPQKMFVAGGQGKNKRWMETKEKQLGIKLEISKIADAELLGDWMITQNQ